MANRTDDPLYPNATNGGRAGRDLTPEERRTVVEIFERNAPVPDDPTLDLPGFVDHSLLERIHRNVLFFLDALHLDHLVNAVRYDDNYVGFLGARIYTVPSTRALNELSAVEPTSKHGLMFEVWYKKDEGWERDGTFGIDWKAIEHCYIRFIRQRVAKLARRKP